jgi:protein-glucosylgalactosylhydroxylysine glucosidase
MEKKAVIIFFIVYLFGLIACSAPETKINREELVTRHNPVITAINSLDALTVGNGNFAFTVDGTGLQTFPDVYENGVPLGTLSNWGWHTFPNVEGYDLMEVTQIFESCADSIPYVYRYFEGEKEPASEYLRQNPHRLHLGQVGYEIHKEDGSVITENDLKDIQFNLDLWTGEITSSFLVEDTPVKTRLFAHQDKDQIAVHVESPLIRMGRLKVKFRFPYGNGGHRTPGYDFTQPEKHSTKINKEKYRVLFERNLDATRFFVHAEWEMEAGLKEIGPHEFLLIPDVANKDFNFSVAFSPESDITVNSFEETANNNHTEWENFWESGGAIDFSGSTDSRANELERRIVLSQYLTKIQSSGNLPPQETGLTYNSWYGKFHLEMHWWHGVHFMFWNRPDLFSNSMDWYENILPQARETARWQGFSGARWPKMVGPDGEEGPSNIAPFLIWQQPHPIYYAELFYRQNPHDSVLNRFKEVVFQTADFMASFSHYNNTTDRYDLCPPLIPAQEIFDLRNTYNPSFELAYWFYALNLAQEWRKRLDMEPDQQWQEVIDKLAPLPVIDSLYLPHQNRPDAYTNPEWRADHPIVLGALGFLPDTEKVNKEIMAKTFDEIWGEWNWDHTWGWDYPLIAMTAARIGKPDKAIDALFMDVEKNTYLKNGHNYQNEELRIYLPGNGGLLTAVAMMAAGWDGSVGENPGFPENGKWKVRWEGFQKMP